MTLEEVLSRVERLFDGQVIFAKKPWTCESEAVVGQLDKDYRVPMDLVAQRMEYFLEVPLAKEVLSVLGSRPATAKERIELLLYYAEHDAYPDWVYRP